MVLRHAGYQVTACASAAEALGHLDICRRDVVVTDLQMPGMDGLEFIQAIVKSQISTEIVMITAHASVRTAVEAMRLGAFDYIEKPFDATRLEESVAQACRRGRLVSAAATNEAVESGIAMVGNSPAMRSLREQIAQIAPTSETVLIQGESGTGKELAARAIHAASRRADSKLVSLNCPVLSEQLTESELFGHRRGAFTGADSDRVGRFELAQGGTLLLDEITEVNLHLQAKLLRVLQEKTFEPVGASESVEADVRILATTNRDLSAEVAIGRFREDLYYRLAVVPVELPPLRKRAGDVSLLTDYFLDVAAARLEQPRRRLEPAAEDLLTNYHWPGNIRELQNVITRACVMATDEVIRADRLRGWLDESESPAVAAEMLLPAGEVSLAEMEKQMILATLERFDGHRARTADALGIGVRTLSGKLRSYGVRPREKQLV